MAPSDTGPWAAYEPKQAPGQVDSAKGPWSAFSGAKASQPGQPTKEPVNPDEGVDLMTQTLYDMAKTPQERHRALEHGYGAGNVKEDQHGLYIEKDGKRMTPKASGMATKAGAFLLSEAAPTVGAAVGGTLGFGSPMPGGALVGAGMGAMAGQSFNDSLLALAGVYDRSPGKQLGELAASGAAGAAGEGVGRLVGRGAAAAMHERGALHGLARWALGADQTELLRAAQLAEHGVYVPMEAYAQNSPMISLVRTWAKKYGHDPVAKAATPYYENRAGKVLEQLGIPKDEVGKLTEPTSAVSYEKTGEALIKKAKEKLAQEDAAFDAYVTSRHGQMAGRMEGAEAEHAKQIESLNKAATEARDSAQQLIDHGWKGVNETEDKMWAAAKLGTQPGDLARDFAKRVWDLRRSISRRARLMYSKAESVAGGGQIDVSKFVGTAKQFLDQLPEELQKTYPSLVRTLSEMENRSLTFGEARSLRTELRDIANHEDLTSNFKNGIYKKLSGEINAAIHAPGNQPKVKDAVKLLDEADRFYADNLARFKDQKVRSIAKQVRAGMPPDPEEMAKVVLQGGNRERAEELKRIVGPEVWGATVAADIRGMMKQSQSLIPGQVDFNRFIDQVKQRMWSGTFDSYPADIQAMLKTQALRAEKNIHPERLDVASLPNDDFKTFMQRAEDMEKKATELSKINPVETLQSELKKMNEEFKAQQSATGEARDADQLNFLTNPTATASKSAQKIVRNPDLLKSALLRFDADGPEIQILRQTAVRDILTMDLEKEGGKKLAERLREEGMTEEVQKRLFPNGMDKDVLQLAEDMKFIFREDGDLGASFSATSQVTNPSAGLPGPLKRAAGKIPTFMVRMIREKQLGQLVNLMTRPETVKWLAKGLRDSPEAREAVRRSVRDTVNTGGQVGAGLAEMLEEIATRPSDPRDTTAAAGPGWRQRYQEKYARPAR